MGELDPRVTLALTLVGLGLTTVQRIVELWRREGVDEDILATIQTEADARLAQWQAMTPPTP
jgi:hypothetical protein